MPLPLVIIIEPDSARRQTLSLLVRAAASVEVADFSRYDDAARALGDARLIICRWEAVGERLLADRFTTADQRQTTELSHLLVLTRDVTQEKIIIAARAGHTDIIPSEPLNLNALRNRILLILEGSSSLAIRLSGKAAALRETLSSLPALRRRLIPT